MALQAYSLPALFKVKRYAVAISLSLNCWMLVLGVTGTGGIGEVVKSTSVLFNGGTFSFSEGPFAS